MKAVSCFCFKDPAIIIVCLVCVSSDLLLFRDDSRAIWHRGVE
jgi:hypothetical protein